MYSSDVEFVTHFQRSNFLMVAIFVNVDDKINLRGKNFKCIYDISKYLYLISFCVLNLSIVQRSPDCPYGMCVANRNPGITSV